jgi:intracellular sulfur oxidation DsrE/DsrF family protein
MHRLLPIALLVFALPAAAQQTSQAGPAIHSGGAVFAIDPDIATPTDTEYKVAFEVSVGEPGQLNVTFNSVARFINMHAQAGVPRENIRTAIVVHGSGGWDLLNDAAYQARNGAANPNAELLQELMDFGTEVILCGQTAASRGIPTDRLVDGAQVALSAMTAFVLLQHDGYLVNPW